MTIERVKKIDINTMDAESIDSTAETMGKRITKILEDAKAEADKILAIYGLKLDLGYEIKSKDN